MEAHRVLGNTLLLDYSTRGPLVTCISTLGMGTTGAAASQGTTKPAI